MNPKIFVAFVLTLAVVILLYGAPGPNPITSNPWTTNTPAGATNVTRGVAGRLTNNITLNLKSLGETQFGGSTNLLIKSFGADVVLYQRGRTEADGGHLSVLISPSLFQVFSDLVANGQIVQLNAGGSNYFGGNSTFNGTIVGAISASGDVSATTLSVDEGNFVVNNNGTAFFASGEVQVGATGHVSAAYFTGKGTGLSNLNASAISTGTVPPARLGSGSSITTKFLRGDSTWQAVSGGGGTTFPLTSSTILGTNALGEQAIAFTTDWSSGTNLALDFFWGSTRVSMVMGAEGLHFNNWSGPAINFDQDIKVGNLAGYGLVTLYATDDGIPTPGEPVANIGKLDATQVWSGVSNAFTGSVGMGTNYVDEVIWTDRQQAFDSTAPAGPSTGAVIFWNGTHWVTNKIASLTAGDVIAWDGVDSYTNGPPDLGFPFWRTNALAFGSVTSHVQNVLVRGTLTMVSAEVPPVTSEFLVADAGQFTDIWGVFDSSSNVVARASPTNFVIKADALAISGIGSSGTNQTLTLTATGMTNTLPVNYVVYLTAATGLSLTNQFGRVEFFGATVAAFTPLRVQPGASWLGTSITYASGAGGNAW